MGSCSTELPGHSQLLEKRDGGIPELISTHIIISVFTVCECTDFGPNVRFSHIMIPQSPCPVEGGCFFQWDNHVECFNHSLCRKDRFASLTSPLCYPRVLAVQVFSEPSRLPEFLELMDH